MSSIGMISCLDSRYCDDVKPLINVCDEFAYYRNRILVEIKYFIKFTGISLLYNPMVDFTQDDFKTILELEKILRHDVKAIEYFIKDIPEIKQTNKSHLIHIGLTSQDICSIGFMLCFTDSIVIIIKQLVDFNTMFYKQLIHPHNCDVYMIGLTHGQPATPTNFKKEMLIYYTRLDTIYNEIINTLSNDITVKFGGATGEFNSMKLILNESYINWYIWCDEFVADFSMINICNTNTNTNTNIDNIPRFKRSQYTNQCDNYDSLTKVLYQLKRLLHILEHLRGNIWLYIHRDYFIQINITTEIGSSTMPNKVNPIDIENAKTAIEMAKRMIDGICDIISETSYQRDLSDSSAIRNISSVFGYILIAFKKLFTGISRLSLNNTKIYDDLDKHPEIILEGIQTYLKYYCNITDAYEQLKYISRGNTITLLDIHIFIDTLNILEEHKLKLKTITPHNYTGYNDLPTNIQSLSPLTIQ